MDDFKKWHEKRGLSSLSADEKPKPYHNFMPQTMLTVEYLIDLHPNTHTAKLNLSQLASVQCVKDYDAKKIRFSSFNEIIYNNEMWLVRGDSTIESCGTNPLRSYQCDGNRIREGLHSLRKPGRYGDTWLCQIFGKAISIENKKLFAEAFYIAYRHKMRMEAWAEILSEKN